MAWQLIFTSAPRGLESGRSGFCTVARHGEIPPRLARELERASAYEPPRGRNPRGHRHARLGTGADAVHVLTRFHGGGRDYTGRTNYVAHHLVLPVAELAGLPAPADILLHWPGWMEAWDAPPRLLDARDVFNPAGIRPPAPALPCALWRELTGDAGNAAAPLAARPAKPLRLLTDPGLEDHLAALLRESSALLPPAAAWAIPFTTAPSAADAATDFAWVAGAADNPLLADSGRFGTAATLRVPGRLRPPAPSLPVQLARHGRAVLGAAECAS